MKRTEERHKIFHNGKATKHDSIFVTEVFTPPETFDKAIELHSFDAFIERKDKAAEQILVGAKLWPRPDKKLARMLAAMEAIKEARDNSCEYFSACVIWWICVLRDAIKGNHTRAAADAAYGVADSANKALLARMEMRIVAGGKSISAGNNDENKARRAAAIERDARLMEMVMRKKTVNPKETDASIARLDPFKKPETQRKRIERARKRSPQT